MSISRKMHKRVLSSVSLNYALAMFWVAFLRIWMQKFGGSHFKGKHITLVGHSRAVETCLGAAKILAGKGIEAEVINLRSLRPLDMKTIETSVAKTHHLVTVEQGWPHCGVGAEILAQIMESEAFFQLDQPGIRITGADVPMPYASSLENISIPAPNDVVQVVSKLLRVK